ncbi:MAG TPA: CoA transferase [Patescibacteria group bacterium]|nr:CoA transferase [Patescibacteria group bacterium]
MDKILEDIRVLDFTHVWFGPWCTMMMAEMGAEVIKIEPPWGGLGRISQGGQMYGGMSSTFHHLNLNKKAIAVNTKEPEGLDLVKELIKKADVVVQNFAPGAMERMGLGYDVLKELNPKIIYAALSGFGQTGPYTSRPSYAVIAEAMAGYALAQGRNADKEGPPVSMTGAFGDLAPGTMAAMSIIAALRYRDKTGKGQMIDVAQLDCMIAYQTDVTAYLVSGKTEKERRLEMEEMRKNRGPGMVRIGGILKCTDGWIHVAGWRAKGMDRLKEIMGTDEIDPDEVKKKIEGMTRDEALAFFVDVGLPVAPILEASEITKDPHAIARDMYTELEHPKMGKYTAINFPVKFTETPGVVHSPAPLLGQHNKEVITDILGWPEEKYIELKKKGVISEST